MAWQSRTEEIPVADGSRMGIRRSRAGRPKVSVGQLCGTRRPGKLCRQEHRFCLERSRDRRRLPGKFTGGRVPAWCRSLRDGGKGKEKQGIVFLIILNLILCQPKVTTS